MGRLFVCVLVVCAWGSAANAATIQAQGCGVAEVAAAVTTAADGDTVLIPAGTCTWTSSVTISSKSITLKGAGVGVTTIIDGISAPSSGAKTPALTWNTKTSGLTRLTDLTFDGGSSGGEDQSATAGIVAVSGASPQLRLDHLTFTNLNRTIGVRVSGNVTGVIDHVTFNVGHRYGLYVFHDSWLGVGGYGDNSWAQPNTWGSAAFLFVEDCEFSAPSGGGINWGSDGWMGQRVVYRRNTYTNVLWANHGTETSGRQRSARASEVYQNTFILDNAGWNSQLCCLGSVIGTRGGSSLVWSNALRTSNGGGATSVFDMANLRSSDSRTFYVFNHCDGFNGFDQNAGPELGYRCIDQPGAGQGDLLSGDNPSPVWLRQQLEPIYTWNNTINGTLSNSVTNGFIPVVEDRDFFNQVSPFTGGRGVGQGTIAQRPATCTTGVAYWATDEGEWDSTNGSAPDGRLYQCTSTNTWTLWYTPAPYPHPLANGVVAPIQPATVTASQSTYTTTQPVGAKFTNASGSPNDWIGVFPAGAANTAYLQWTYLNGSQTASTAVINGTVTFPNALGAPGNYELRLFFNGTNTAETSAPFTVQGPATPASISTASTTYSPSQPIVANFAGAAGGPSDWVGLFAAGAPSTSYLQWLFVNGTQTATNGVTSGSVTFPAGLVTPGSYEARLFFNDTFVPQASATFTVKAPPAPAIAPGKTSYARGETITATFANASGSAKDWIGLFAAGASNTSRLNWAYVNGSRTSGAALTSGTVTFAGGLTTAGNYEVRLFINDTTTVEAVAAFTVKSGTPTIVTDKTLYGPTKPIIATFTNASGSARDWIGLYAVGASNLSPVKRLYINGLTTPTTAPINGTVTFSAGAPKAGSYELRFFSNDTYTLMAKTGTLTVKVGVP